MSDPLRSKALSVLREGRLTVVLARSGPDNRPFELVAAVRSSRRGGPTYAVDLAGGVWSCTCTAGQPCGHVAAAQMVAGAADREAAA